jgi:hypothetical protein
MSETTAPVNNDVPPAVQQLRVVVCGLGALVLVMSVALTAFVVKQNRHYQSLSGERHRLAGQLQSGQRVAGAALQELAQLSQRRPELQAIFQRHGVQVQPPPGR